MRDSHTLQSTEELKQAFQEHLEQTQGQIQRLEQIFEMLDERPTGKKCSGMEGLLKEGAEVMNEDFEDEVMDAALIAAAQRVEHYEIAAYGTVCAFADLLQEPEHASLLRETLEEEKETDQKLTQIAEEVNSQALETGEEGEQKTERRGPQRSSTRRKTRRVA